MRVAFIGLPKPDHIIRIILLGLGPLIQNFVLFVNRIIKGTKSNDPTRTNIRFYYFRPQICSFASLKFETSRRSVLFVFSFLLLSMMLCHVINYRFTIIDLCFRESLNNDKLYTCLVLCKLCFGWLYKLNYHIMFGLSVAQRT